ncbi:MAG: hypothetical protein J6Q65_08535 [Lentisphaeria bacterium]|nr:hypothetical protein [Lentisphaeria bacterium]
MIPLLQNDFYNVYILLWLAILAILWFREERRVAKSDWAVVKEKLYLCDKCHHSFLAGHDQEHITRCPRCNEMCFIRKRKKF